MAVALEIAELEHFVDPRPQFSARHFFEAAAKPKIFRHPHIFGQRIIFRHVTDVALGGFRLAGDGEAADFHRAGVGGQIAGENAHRRAFAGAVGAEQADNLSAFDGETEVIDGGQAAVSFYEMRDLNGDVGNFGHAVDGTEHLHEDLASRASLGIRSSARRAGLR